MKLKKLFSLIFIDFLFLFILFFKSTIQKWRLQCITLYVEYVANSYFAILSFQTTETILRQTPFNFIFLRLFCPALTIVALYTMDFLKTRCTLTLSQAFNSVVLLVAGFYALFNSVIQCYTNDLIRLDFSQTLV